jgi:hypothetical protein
VVQIHAFTDHKNLTFDTLKCKVSCIGAIKLKSFHLHCTILSLQYSGWYLSWLHCLVTPAQIAEGKSLTDPAVDFDDKDELYISEQEHTGLNDDEK